MTSQSPRIYTYKITFEEVPYYYYGVHKEKKYNEYYMGSPKTHKWCWEFYTPKKQILELFEYGDKGWEQANKVEKRLIRPVFNTDKWCLNEGCAGNVSLKIKRKIGKNAYKNKIGIHGLTEKQRSENAKKGRRAGLDLLPADEKIKIAKKGGKKSAELKLGVHSFTPERRIKNGSKGGNKSGPKTYELGLGIFGLTKEQQTQNASKGGNKSGPKTYELGLGIFGLTKEQQRNNGIKGGKIAGKITGSQLWECTITGYRSTPGPLSRYQKARGIDTSNRIRIQ